MPQNGQCGNQSSLPQIMRQKTFLPMYLNIVYWMAFADVYAYLEQAVRDINAARKTELNVFVNLIPANTDALVDQQFLKLSQRLSHLPKLITTQETVLGIPLQKLTTGKLLVVAWLEWSKPLTTIQALEQLLWQWHFKDIVLIGHPQAGVAEEQHFLEIFKLCWRKGFTSVLILANGKIWTYHPYPGISVKLLTNAAEIRNKTHLNNFHLYTWPQAAVEFAPRFWSRLDAKGNRIYCGYIYRLIATFYAKHNATVKYYDFDLMAPDSEKNLLHLVQVHGFALAPFLVSYTPKLLPSKVLYLHKVILMVPAGKPIPDRQYLAIAFNRQVYWTILFCSLLLCILILIVTYHFERKIDFSSAMLQTIEVILACYYCRRSHGSLLSWQLFVVFAFTGIFVTNFYSSSLSSVYISKVCEPSMETYADIDRTSLQVAQHSDDVPSIKKMKLLPSFIKRRLISPNNTELFIIRRELNMTYIYSGVEDIIDYFMMQQMYIKYPVAIKLKQVFNYRPYFIHMLHGCPLYEQFNSYLTRLMDSGLHRKFVYDSYLEGLYTGNLRIMMDSDELKPLSVQFFQYAFAILIIGLCGAFLILMVELAFLHQCSKKVRNSNDSFKIC